MTESQFRTAFCKEVSIMISCSATEVTTPKLLYLDLRSFSTFAAIPTTIPRVSTSAYADIDTSSSSMRPEDRNPSTCCGPITMADHHGSDPPLYNQYTPFRWLAADGLPDRGNSCIPK